MSSKNKFISRKDLTEFLEALSVENNIFHLTDLLEYVKFEKEVDSRPAIDAIRSTIPLKAFFVNHGEKLEHSGDSREKANSCEGAVTKAYGHQTANIIFGVKACDLKAKIIMDEIYLKGVCSDPFYEFNNDNTIIFSSDCPYPSDTCFCNVVGGKPYAESKDYLFDLNFSAMEKGCMVDIGTEKGDKIIASNARFFRDATSQETALREQIRKNAVVKLEDINSAYAGLKNLKLESVLKEKFDSLAWKEFSQTCVQCGGCNNACPSCYCFYLDENIEDKASDELAPKTRLWDACHYTSYGRVAGGANSRPHLYERFRNRYECKFNYRKENFGIYACTGCGRCVSVCPGKIDIRQVLVKLAGEK
ncbi:MAG: 4Fe-4S dicluster domain-containing protein [Elusimicrobia bacterium]|nr:4Fe-4S dicluster domain-containing protein [Elusimicrobiota bacterium]